MPRARRADLDAPLDAKELRSFRAACGSLQWLVAQPPVDVAYKVSVLQGELKAPTVGSLLKANAVIAECRNTADFFLPFGMCDLENGGILGVSDAALGNVNDRGTEGAENEKDSRVHSQAGYLCFFADQTVLRGGSGRVFLLDWRSHRLKRVGNSSYMVGTYGLEGCVDACQLLRGVLAEMRGFPMKGATAQIGLESVECTTVVDAKDTHDKVTTDLSTIGARRSLAFTVAWLKQQFRGANLGCRWTSAENMIGDCLTKYMEGSHLRRTLVRGTWSFTYHPDFLKAKVKSARRSTPPTTLAPHQPNEIPGDALDAAEEERIASHAEHPGWACLPGRAIQVAKGAKSFRTPEPRFAAAEFPFRTTYGSFRLSNDHIAWRRLESRVEYLSLPNQHRVLPIPALLLVTVFGSPQEGVRSDSTDVHTVRQMTCGRSESEQRIRVHRVFFESCDPWNTINISIYLCVSPATCPKG